MELVHEFTFNAMLRPPLPVGEGPYGTRMFFEAYSGTADGARVKGELQGGGGDWILVGPDGYGRIDVRFQLATHDGAFIYAQYFGVLEMNEKFQAAMASATATDWGDQYFRVTPRFETGDPRYAWMNQTVFVAEGHLIDGFGVEYRVSRVA